VNLSGYMATTATGELHLHRPEGLEDTAWLRWPIRSSD
jgi:hypothetical protein